MPFDADYIPVADLWLRMSALVVLLTAIGAGTTRGGALWLSPLLLVGVLGLWLAFTYMDTIAGFSGIAFIAAYSTHAAATVWRLTRKPLPPGEEITPFHPRE
ncbi:MAG: hypothetical protein RL701_8103 [Pseudomonadota bacterium]|jgi:hypothetical protein